MQMPQINRFKQFLFENEELYNLQEEVLDFFQELEQELSEEEISIIIDALLEHDSISLNYLDYEINLEEKISVLGRMKKSRNMKKIQKKLQKAKTIKAQKNIITKTDIESKARKAAVKILKDKWSKGKTDRKTKEQIEDKLAKSSQLIAKLAKKQKKDVLAKERQRKSVKGINENEENLAKIKAILDEMNSEELDDFGSFLVDVFLDDLPEDEYDQDFGKEDIMEMIKALGYDFYDEILDELQNIEDDWDEDGKTSDTNEAVSRRMKTSAYNRKKRKYMDVSKSELRQTRAKRRQEARKSKTSRKRYYKANKQKIAQYQKSRREAIKKGKHKVKQRRSN